MTRTRQAVLVEALRPERFFIRTFNATSLYILSICEVCGSYQCPYCPHFNHATTTTTILHTSSLWIVVTLYGCWLLLLQVNDGRFEFWICDARCRTTVRQWSGQCLGKIRESEIYVFHSLLLVLNSICISIIYVGADDVRISHEDVHALVQQRDGGRYVKQGRRKVLQHFLVVGN